MTVKMPGDTSTFTGADMSTKLKLLGVDVASFGDAFAKSAKAKEIVVADTFQGIYKKLVLNQDGSRILGGILVGDASAYGTLLQFMQNEIALPPHPEDLLMPPRAGIALLVWEWIVCRIWLKFVLAIMSQRADLCRDSRSQFN